MLEYRSFKNVILSEARAERKRGEGKRRIFTRSCEPMLSELAQQTLVGESDGDKILRVALASHAQLALAQDDTHKVVELKEL